MTGGMPARPVQHELATASVRAFESALPDTWTASVRGDVEYGVDLDVEIFVEGRATGLRFPVQLKSTETLGARSPSVSIKWSTWNYWSSHDTPVLVVLWERESGTLWWRWAHHHDTYGSDDTTASFTFKFDSDQTWQPDTAAKLESEVRAWRAWQEADRHLPLSIVVTADGQVGAVPSSRIVARFRTIIAGFPDLVQVRQQPAGHLYLSVRVGPTESVAWLSGGPSATLHYEQLEITANDDEIADQLTADLVLLLTIHLSRLRLIGEAARMAAAVVNTARTIFEPTIAYGTMLLFLRGRRIDDAMALLGRLVQGGPSEASIAALSGLMSVSGTLDPGERSRVVATLLSWAEAELPTDPHDVAGTLTYNAARFVGGEDPARAVELYDLARDRHPAYDGRNYWWRERAGFQFLAGRYVEAAAGYQRALELGDDRCRPLLADALMFSGRYGAALEHFDRLEGTEIEKGEWKLKRRSLNFLIDRFGIEDQDRVPERAARIAESSNEPEQMRQVLDLDLLCGEALFKLAQGAAEAGEPSGDLFLASALADPSLPTPWLYALLRVPHDMPEVFEDVAVTARRFVGTDIVNLLLEEGNEELAGAVADIFEELPPDAAEPFEVRVVGPDSGDVAVVDLSDPTDTSPADN